MTGSDSGTPTFTGIDLVVDGLRALGHQRSPTAVMHVITSAAAASLADAADAGLTMLTADRFTTLAATSELATTVDSLQYTYGGPCLDALIDDETVIIHADDLREEPRWPAFTAVALAQTPVLSVLSYRLYLDRHHPIGSLNVYARKPHAFGHDMVHAGERLAAYAAAVLAYTLEQDRTLNLERALESDREIGAAIGILMSRHLATPDHAFDLLRTASRRSDRKLRQVAQAVIQTGDLDDQSRPEHRGMHDPQPR